jgi:ribosome-associated heat shock protein Hsp15
VVRGLSERRGPASEAAALYEERPESTERRAAIRLQLSALPPPAPGRPTKKDRREIRRLKGEE